MRNAPFIDDGHRLESTMRMLADAELMGGGREIGRARMVHQQEG